MRKLRKDIEQVLLTGNSTSWDWRKGRGVMPGFVLYVTFSHIVSFTTKAICENSLPQILQLLEGLKEKKGKPSAKRKRKASVTKGQLRAQISH